MPSGDHDPEFVTFWTMYGGVGPRLKAWECWQRARRHAAAEDIIAGLEKWVQYWQMPGAAAVKWPQGWLNDRYWENDPPTFLTRIQRPQTHATSVLAHVTERRRQATVQRLPGLNP